MSIVNTRLMSHPLNWLVIWSMVLVFAYTLHLITHATRGTHPGATQSSTEGIAGPGTDIPENVFA